MAFQTIGIVGAGTMGVGIAQTAATAGVNVVLVDVSDAVLQQAMQHLTKNLDRQVKAEKLKQSDKDAALARVRTTTAYADLAAADAVIEAATENEGLKTQILKQIAAAVRPDTIIGTNTSSISITKLASTVSNPGRFVGMHFFNPVPLMKLVEVIRGLQTTDETHDRVTQLAEQLGKTLISVKNTPGFVVNRVLLPMINEAFFVLAEGGRAEDIDEGMKLGCNHPMGPLALADLIGLDVVHSIMEVFHRDFADSKYRPCPLLKEMVDAGYLGRKSGRGVYHY